MTRIDEAARIALPSYVRMRFDKLRDRHVLLAPERVLFPCPMSVTIIERLGDGRALVGLIDELASEFEAPRQTIAGDVGRMLGDLADQGFLEVRP